MKTIPQHQHNLFPTSNKIVCSAGKVYGNGKPTTLTNQRTLDSKMISEILEDHGVETYNRNGQVMALDCSSYKGKLISVWIYAPTTTATLFDWLGY